MSGSQLQWSVFMVEAAARRVGAGDTGTPVLVVSRESANDALPVVTVLPLAGLKADRHIYPNETLLPPESTALDFPAILMAHQIRTIPKNRLSTRMGSIDDPGLRAAVRAAVQVQLDLDAGTDFRSENTPSLESGI